ncbi:MFS general substrate transporter, partial [Myriangium duriaei CBS 260.36]
MTTRAEDGSLASDAYRNDVKDPEKDYRSEELNLPDDPDAGKTDAEKAAEDKRLLRKLDIRLIPWLSLLYLISFLDRTNIGNAKVAGMTKDLHLTNGQYNATLSIFFVSYSVFEPLTNVMMKRFRPRYFLAVCMFLWGICMMSMGFVKDWRGLAAARFFLGLMEAGLFPGVNYLLSCWYRRNELGIRLAIFFSAAALAGSFGGLLAAGIAQMKGIRGIAGWAWIFILEGLFTVVVGVICIWAVPDFPDEATFLDDGDRLRVIRRLKQDKQSSASHEGFKMTYFWAAIKDWKTLAYSIIYMGADGPLYAFSLFLPTIISELGYSSTRANLLSVPPYAAAAILTVTIGYIADRTGQRGWCNICVSVLGVVGFALLASTTLPGLKYAAVFLAALGIYPCIANTISWAANNTEGVYKRGVTLGILIGWGNLNGVMSSNAYQTTDAPNFRTGHGIVLAYLTLFLLGGSIVTHFALERENKLRREGRKDHLIEGKTEQDVALLGDKVPGFIYTT